ncbi:hypothetical protein I551_4115 [Mycobacterium ulcerans str. Harvey]|uniref:Uncharacterized protein n=1 Tax=Mycobacterium ulcerans str. Harvey TaxID=1299332 RepID=A0ABP3AGB2_MYCUL|nr:hypothetical protein I551_4115 [Mycobacterium ulcerans str. Harvey]
MRADRRRPARNPAPSRENALLERGLLPSPLLLDSPESTSSPGTGPAAKTRCCAATSMTSCKRRPGGPRVDR